MLVGEDRQGGGKKPMGAVFDMGVWVDRRFYSERVFLYDLGNLFIQASIIKGTAPAV